jgi:hypothetical protein
MTQMKYYRNAQLKLYKVMVVPILTRACENWALSRCDTRKIESPEMRFLRQASEHRREDRIMNTGYQTKNS